MLRASITFFVLGIVSMLLGLNSIAGMSVEIGKMLLVVFLILSVISFFVGKTRGKSALALAFCVLVAGSFTANPSYADETVSEKAKEMGNDTKRAGKDAVRQVKDKTCEMVNGKMHCAAQKVKHTIQKGADHVEDAVD